MEGIHPRVPSGEPGHRQLLGDGVIHLDDVCLVTGGAGFIGANLVHALLRQGMRVRVFDDLSTGDPANLAGLGDRVEFVRGDVRDEEAVRAAAQGAAVVFHLAAMTSEAASVADPAAAHAINATGTLHVLLGARDAGCQRVVVASSAEVYGDQDAAALSEELPAWPMTPFAASQLAAERYATAFFYAYALPTVSLRFFNVYGPRERTDGEGGVVASFIRAVLDGRPMAIEGDGEQTRDFVHVGDAVQALLLASDAHPRRVRRRVQRGGGGPPQHRPARGHAGLARGGAGARPDAGADPRGGACRTIGPGARRTCERPSASWGSRPSTGSRKGSGEPCSGSRNATVRLRWFRRRPDPASIGTPPGCRNR